jgi:hypothetical protein
VTTRPDDSNAPYLPQRYRQQVLAKKQRRVYKKLVMVSIVIVVFIVACFLLISMLSGTAPSAPSSPPETTVTPIPTTGEQTPAPEVKVTVAATPSFVTRTGISVLHTSSVLPLDNAVSFLREDYPEKTYRLISANLTDRYTGHLLYEFVIQPAEDPQGEAVTVFEDAVSGDPYTPGQEQARITAGEAQDRARGAFSSVQPDRVRVRYSAGTDADGTWNFVLVKGSSPMVTGTMDAGTGLITSFTRTLQKPGRPAEPVLDLPAAQKIADRYISDRNGPVAVNMSNGRYFPLGSPSDPVAGQYILVFNRMVSGIPCDTEGFVVGVDAANGEITAYERNWNTPEIAFSVISEQRVLKREATYTVLKKAQETFPESVSGLRIISAEMRWKDQPPSDRPSSIPLTWKVVFDDDIIRANRSAQPAVAWVDVQSGSILDFDYRH